MYLREHVPSFCIQCLIFSLQCGTRDSFQSHTFGFTCENKGKKLPNPISLSFPGDTAVAESFNSRKWENGSLASCIYTQPANCSQPLQLQGSACKAPQGSEHRKGTQWLLRLIPACLQSKFQCTKIHCWLLDLRTSHGLQEPVGTEMHRGSGNNCRDELVPKAAFAAADATRGSTTDARKATVLITGLPDWLKGTGW